MKTTNFTIIDDHRLFADGLARILQDDSSFVLVRVYNSGVEYLANIDQPSDLFIIDIQLGDMSGLDICKEIRTKHTEAKIILISMIQAPHLIRLAEQNGADGFIPKTTDAILLKSFVNQVCDDVKVFVKDLVEGAQQINLLTDREMEIIHLIKTGMTTKAIAEKLFLSEFTVETHRKNILKKLKISTANELIAYAYANHL